MSAGLTTVHHPGPLHPGCHLPAALLGHVTLTEPQAHACVQQWPSAGALLPLLFLLCRDWGTSLQVEESSWRPHFSALGTRDATQNTRRTRASKYSWFVACCPGPAPDPGGGSVGPEASAVSQDAHARMCVHKEKRSALTQQVEASRAPPSLPRPSRGSQCWGPGFWNSDCPTWREAGRGAASVRSRGRHGTDSRVRLGTAGPSCFSLLREEEDDADPVSPSGLQDKVKGTRRGVLRPPEDSPGATRARGHRATMMPGAPQAQGDGDPGRSAPRAHETVHQIWRSTFQTFRTEVHFPGHPIYLGCPPTLQEEVCCECQTRFRGHWPVPRAEAALPYWVPLSLRPQKQIHRTVRFCIPKAIKTCTCPCHHFGGRLPLPRNQAVMPYWVPRGLRPQRKVMRKQRSCKALRDAPLDLRFRHNRWRICCSGRPLVKWQQLQAIHQDELLALGRAASPPAPFLTLLQAFLRVVMAIRQYFWI